jgi:hypothetical protein
MDRIFFRIMARDGNRIRLKALHAIELDGKKVPGEVDPEGDAFWRQVKMVDGREYGCAYSVSGMALWLRLYRKPKGGKRVGAGRPKGGGKGRVQQSRSICLSQPEWELFDQLRGRIPRGKFVSKLLSAEALRSL